jgi:hypothetical protein
MNDIEQEQVVNIDSVNQDEFNLKVNLSKCTLLPLDNDYNQFEVTRTFNAAGDDKDKDAFVKENELIKSAGRIYEYTPSGCECTVSAILTYDELNPLMKSQKNLHLVIDSKSIVPVAKQQTLSVGFILFPLTLILLLVLWGSKDS